MPARHWNAWVRRWGSSPDRADSETRPHTRRLIACNYEAVGKSTGNSLLFLSCGRFVATIALTWAEDRATRARDPSAVPGATTEGGGTMPPSCSFPSGTKALNAPDCCPRLHLLLLPGWSPLGLHSTIRALAPRFSLPSADGLCRPTNLDTPRRPFIATFSRDLLAVSPDHGGIANNTS